MTLTNFNNRFWIKSFLIKSLHILLIAGLAIIFTGRPASGARIKDIARIVGVRENQLIGYGLVIGLNGTGDKKGTTFTIQTLTSMLVKMGIRVAPGQVNVKNVAAVIVTAELPPFTRHGMRLDVLVSSIGDAKTLQGGTLLLTPLRAVDGNVYALAQGPLSVGGFAAAAGGDSAQKNHPTVGTIPGGALVEKELAVPFRDKDYLDFVLRDPDFTTAEMMSKAMNERMGMVVASTLDSRTVSVKVPPQYQNRVIDFISLLETTEIRVDTPARIVINERSGTIIMGENVRISTVAISHGGLSVVIREEKEVSQPLPFSKGETVVLDRKEVEVTEESARLMVVPQGISLGQVVKALNAVGVTPRDLITILQVMKNAGALNAEIVIM